MLYREDNVGLTQHIKTTYLQMIRQHRQSRSALRRSGLQAAASEVDTMRWFGEVETMCHLEVVDEEVSEVVVCMAVDEVVRWKQMRWFGEVETMCHLDPTLSRQPT